MVEVPIDEAAEIRARLAAVKAKRGYLLPHHGLMAVASPDLLEAYDRAYTALALDMKRLDEHDREFVWLAVLIATNEALASHHIAKFRRGGGTDAEIEACLRLTAFAVGARAYGFVAAHWRPHLPGLDIDLAYREGLSRAVRPVPLRLATMAAAAVHAARGDWPGLERAIAFAYAEAVAEVDLAEALSIMMFPGSVPRFVEAAGLWRDMILAKKIEASPAFAAWAGLEGQGGFDEAAGVAP